MTVSTNAPTVLNEIESLRNRIAELVALPETDDPIISAYLDLLEPPDSLRSKLQHWAVAARSTLSGKQRRSFDDARHDVDCVIKQDWPEDTRSVAVFSRGGESPYLLVLPFSAPLELHFDVSSMPLIFPLVQLKDRFHRFVVVIATEDASRIFEVTLGAISEEILTQKPDLGGRLGREWGREHFHQRKRESDRRFHQDQVTIITHLMAKRGLNHLILAGNPRHVAGLREILPKQIASLLVGELLKTPSGGDFSVVLGQAVDKFIEVESAESRSTVERVHEQVRRRALAVVGVENSRAAILGGHAAELVISEELPVLVREELTRLATLRNVPIEVCEKDELLATHGGVGCLLRYRPADLSEN
jgi:ribosomal protein L30E